MNGIVNVLKPVGMTSSDVVMWLRKVLGIKKIGHTGTLDPGVAGVLPICVGNATRIAEYLTDEGKAYRAEVTFGVKTDSQDSYGNELYSAPTEINKEDFLEVLPSFTGAIEQVPPMYSAVKIGGKHLYELARQGLEIERAKKEVQIYNIKLLKWEEADFPRASFDVECSKGTYIRTLCADLGEALGCGGYMSFLLRTRSGLLVIEDSLTLEEIEECVRNKDYSFIYPAVSVLSMKSIGLPEHRVKAFLNGLPSDREVLDDTGYQEEKLVKVLADSTLIGIGIWRNDKLYPHKVFIK